MPDTQQPSGCKCRCHKTWDEPSPTSVPFTDSMATVLACDKCRADHLKANAPSDPPKGWTPEDDEC